MMTLLPSSINPVCATPNPVYPPQPRDGMANSVSLVSTCMVKGARSRTDHGGLPLLRSGTHNAVIHAPNLEIDREHGGIRVVSSNL